MDYIDIKPLALDEPLIALETLSGEVVDLYNDSSLCAIALDRGGLRFDFAHVLLDEIAVRFVAVQNLRVWQPEDWVPEEFTQIEHLLVRRPGDYRTVVFKAGGLTFEFDCAAIGLEL